MVRPRNPNLEYLPDSRGAFKAYVRINCETCGEEALVRADGLKRFCSKKCSATKQHAEGRSRQQRGTEHYAWKGDDADYQAVHARIARTRGRADHCEWRATAHCTSRKYEWSHIHGTNPADVMNYRSLCKTCHQRYDGQTGADHANSRLTPQQVSDIRVRYAAGGISQQALADEYGIHQTTVSGVILRQTYR